VKKIILTIAIVLVTCAYAWAGDCSLELDRLTAATCDRQYASGAAICREMHPDPLDYNDLWMCLQYSRDVYRKCTGWCGW
jgi:hypothetical protein